MKRDFSAIVCNFEGEAFKDPEGKDITLKRVCVDALGAGLDADRQENGEAVMCRYALAQRIVTSTKENALVELSTDELKLLKDRVCKVWGAFLAGAAVTILESDPVEK